MKVLHTVEFYRPSVGGAQEVVRQISERLVERGHDVTVATTKIAARSFSEINGVKIEQFKISGNEASGFQGNVAAYQGFLRSGKFDVMMNYAAQQWTADLAFPLLKELPYAKLFCPCGFSGLRWKAYASYFKNMPSVLSAYDRLLFHSGTYQDINFAKQHRIENLDVIPNGCAHSEFSAEYPSFREHYGIPANLPLLLSVGSHTGSKGHSESIEAFRRAKIGRAVLVIIGNCLGSEGCRPRCRRKSTWTMLSSFGRKRVLLLDVSRSWTVAAFHAADLFVFPSNIECSPLVLFEAMASRTPFISTPCGNAAEIAAWGKSGTIVQSTIRANDGFIVADPHALVAEIERLVADPQTRASMAESGYQVWEQRHTWENIVLEYERVYEQAIATHRKRLAA